MSDDQFTESQRQTPQQFWSSPQTAWQRAIWFMAMMRMRLIVGMSPYSLNAAQGERLTLDRFHVTPLGAGQPDLGDVTIDVSNIAYLGGLRQCRFLFKRGTLCLYQHRQHS